MREINWMLLSVKAAVTIFNVPATWYVFLDMFKHTDRPDWLAYFNTFMAILAVDMVFLYILQELESSKSPIKRLPAAITALLMVVLIITIGILDEGTVLAFAPRAGMILLVFNDMVSWSTDWRLLYRSREHQEQRIRDEEVLERKKVSRDMFKLALNEEKNQFKEKHRQRILSQLNLDDHPDQSEQIITVTGDTPMLDEPLPDGIFETDSGAYGWQSPVTGETFLTTSTGKEYTLPGAKIALSRHEKEFSKNGR